MAASSKIKIEYVGEPPSEADREVLEKMHGTTGNPYSERQWPYGRYNDQLTEDLLNATYGASTIVNLLWADDNVQNELRDMDDPTGAPKPFSPNVRSGLFSALSCVMAHIDISVDNLMERKIS